MSPDRTDTGTRRPSQRPKKKEYSGHKTHVEPWKCGKCGAMVFVLEPLHCAVCSEYRNNRILVDGSHKYFEQYKKEKEEESSFKEMVKKAKGTKRRKKKTDE